LRLPLHASHVARSCTPTVSTTCTN